MTFIILFNIGGYFLLFKLAQYKIYSDIKKEIIRGLSNDDLVLFVYNPDQYSNIKWRAFEKEFSLNGNMYDVVKISQHENLRFLYCINDIKEKKLIENYAKKHHKDKDNKHKRPLNHKYCKPSCISVICTANYRFDFLMKYNFYTFSNSDLEAPPPKFQLL